MVEIYEDYHDESHYHLGSDRFDQPNAQNKIFKKIVKILEKELPPELTIKYNRAYSINIIDSKNRSYLFMNCYKYCNKKYRVKIIPYPRGFNFLKNVFVPLLKKIEVRKWLK